MKKFLAGLLAVGLVLLQLGAAITPIAADEPSVVTVKAIYYADHAIYPTAVAQSETATKDGDSLGGKVRWDYGVLTIEPATGYTIDSVYAARDRDSLDQFIASEGNEGWAMQLTVTTFGAVKDNLVSGPSNLDTLIASIADATKTIFLPRQNYLDIQEYEMDLFVVLKDSENTKKYVKLKLGGDTKRISEETRAMNTDYRFDANEEIGSFLTANGLDITNDIKINKSASMGYEIDHTTISDDQQTFRCAVNGYLILTLTSKKDGRAIEYNVPIAKPTFAENVIIKSSGEDLDGGDPYYWTNVMMGEGETAAEVEIRVKLPEGVSIVWNKTRVNQYFSTGDGCFKANQEVTAKTYRDDEKIEYTLRSSVDATTGETILYMKKSEGFSEPIYVTLTDGSTEYIETIYITSKSSIKMGISGLRADRYSAVPYSVHSIFEFMEPVEEGLTKAEAQAKFLDYLNSGALILQNFCGMELVKDADGKYTGECIICRSGFRLDVVNAQTKQSIAGADLLIVCNRREAVLAGEKVSLADFIGEQWGDAIEVEINGTGFAYDAETKMVSTPTTVSGAYTTGEVIVKCTWNETFVIGAVTINVISQDKYDDALAEIIDQEMGNNEEISIDSADSPNKDKDKGTLISKKILNALKGKTEAHLKISTKDKNREIVWDFNSDSLKGASADLMVDVQVSDVKVSGQAGVELKFQDNGVLPGTAYVRISLTAAEAKSLGIETAGQKVLLQYRDPAKGKFVTEQDSLTVYADPLNAGSYYIEAPVTHNSTFVLTTAAAEKLGTFEVVKNEDKKDTTTDKDTDKKDTTTDKTDTTSGKTDVTTGDPVRTGAWITIMVLALGAFVVAAARKKAR